MGICLLIAALGLEGTFGDAHSMDLMLWVPSGDWLLGKKLGSGQGKVCPTVEHPWRNALES